MAHPYPESGFQERHSIRPPSPHIDIAINAPSVALAFARKRRISFLSDIASQFRSLYPSQAQKHHSTIWRQSQTKIPVQDTERHFYPSNPHRKTNAEVEGTEYSTFQPAPGIAPIRTFVIESNHSIVRRWNDVCKEIINKLEGGSISWEAIECFRRRQHSTKADDIDDATIVITMKNIPPMTDDLREVLHDIHILSGMFFSST